MKNQTQINSGTTIVNKGIFRRIFKFSGRITKSEYAISTMFYFFVLFVDKLFDKQLEAGPPAVMLMYGLLLLFACYIQISQSVKRSHDVGHSGWWILIPFYAFVLLFLNGESVTNDYGTCPEL